MVQSVYPVHCAVPTSLQSSTGQPLSTLESNGQPYHADMPEAGLQKAALRLHSPRALRTPKWALPIVWPDAFCRPPFEHLAQAGFKSVSGRKKFPLAITPARRVGERHALPVCDSGLRCHAVTDHGVFLEVLSHSHLN